MDRFPGMSRRNSDPGVDPGGGRRIGADAGARQPGPDGTPSVDAGSTGGGAGDPGIGESGSGSSQPPGTGGPGRPHQLPEPGSRQRRLLCSRLRNARLLPLPGVHVAGPASGSSPQRQAGAMQPGWTRSGHPAGAVHRGASGTFPGRPGHVAGAGGRGSEGRVSLGRSSRGAAGRSSPFPGRVPLLRFPRRQVSGDAGPGSLGGGTGPGGLPDASESRGSNRAPERRRDRRHRSRPDPVEPLRCRGGRRRFHGSQLSTLLGRRRGSRVRGGRPVPPGGGQAGNGLRPDGGPVAQSGDLPAPDGRGPGPCGHPRSLQPGHLASRPGGTRPSDPPGVRRRGPHGQPLRRVPLPGPGPEGPPLPGTVRAGTSLGRSGRGPGDELQVRRRRAAGDGRRLGPGRRPFSGDRRHPQDTGSLGAAAGGRRRHRRQGPMGEPARRAGIGSRIETETKGGGGERSGRTGAPKPIGPAPEPPGFRPAGHRVSGRLSSPAELAGLVGAASTAVRSGPEPA